MYISLESPKLQYPHLLDFASLHARQYRVLVRVQSLLYAIDMTLYAHVEIFEFNHLLDPNSPPALLDRRFPPAVPSS